MQTNGLGYGVGIDENTKASVAFEVDLPPIEAINYVLAQPEARTRPIWGPLVNQPDGVFANVSLVIGEGSATRVLTAAAPTTNLATTLTELDSGEGGVGFIIAGTDRLIAHSMAEIAATPSGLSGTNEMSAESALTNAPAAVERPRELPAPLSRFNHPVLLGLMQDAAQFDVQINGARDADVIGVRVDDREYIVITKKMPDYSPEGWVVGAYFTEELVSSELRRAAASGFAGLTALAVAVVLALFLARRVTRPLAQLAGRTGQIAAFEFDRVAPLPRSRVRELDQVANAFNSMVAGLKAMNFYVPRSLFRKLMKQGAQAGTPHEIPVTIMFTDIAGFTSLSESMSAAETAALLNAHFALLVRAVEKSGGTVDIFIGDGMMAFWGAPDENPDHARQGLAAALEIAAAIKDRNAAIAREGAPPIRLRIGLHSGPVIAGNVGALDRWNYTIVGDAVNVAQRLEQLGRHVDPTADVIVLASAATLADVSVDIACSPVGTHQLAGRQETIDVWRLACE